MNYLFPNLFKLNFINYLNYYPFGGLSRVGEIKFGKRESTFDWYYMFTLGCEGVLNISGILLQIGMKRMLSHKIPYLHICSNTILFSIQSSLLPLLKKLLKKNVLYSHYFNWHATGFFKIFWNFLSYQRYKVCKYALSNWSTKRL